LTGVSTLTWHSKSPEPLCLIAGMPLPLNLKSLEVCVPAGTLIFSLPLSVGTSIDPPSAEVAKSIGTSQYKSFPSRSNIACSLI